MAMKDAPVAEDNVAGVGGGGASSDGPPPAGR